MRAPKRKKASGGEEGVRSEKKEGGLKLPWTWQERVAERRICESNVAGGVSKKWGPGCWFCWSR